MGAGHGHGVTVGHVGARYRWRLAMTFVLVAGFMLVELIFGVLTGSLALLSDAGHMAADVVALGAALLATKLATRSDETGRRTYGSYRAEVFASGFTVLIMLLVAAYVVFEGVRRIGDPVDVETGPMLAVGAIGLIINAVSIFLLREGAKESLNVKGAYFEVVADAAGSVGVIVAGLLVATTGSGHWDTAVALGIGVFVAGRALYLGRQVLAVLAQHAPEHIDMAAVVVDLEAIDGVVDVHDLHVWTLTSGMNVATAHLLIDESASGRAVLTQAQELLLKRYAIEHATLQTEAERTPQCHEVQW